MTTDRIVIEGWLPHPTVNARNHWAKAVRHKQADQDIVAVAARTGRLNTICSECGKAKLAITFVFPVKRRRDADNLYARAKSTIDALVRGGYLVDDNTDMLELSVSGVHVRGQKRTIIELRKAPA